MVSVTVPASAHALRARFARATPRERGLLAILAAAALLWLPYAAHDWAAGRALQLTDDTARLQAIVQADDAGRLKGSASRIADLEARARAWALPAPSFAVARVLAEQEAALAAAQGGLTNLRVQGADAAETLGGLGFVRVEVGADFSWNGLAGTVRRLAATRPGTLVESAATDGEGETTRLRLVLLTPFVTPPGRRG